MSTTFSDNEENSSTTVSTSISIILSREKKNNPRIAVAACIPKKRDGLDDPVRFSLMHFSFLDDSRNYTNLNALLTRLGNIDIAHVACTDITQVRNTGI